MNLIQASVQALLPASRKTAHNGWVSFNAVCCHHRNERQDKRKRGGILFTDQGFTYSCFNCGFKAGWQPGKLLSKNTKDLLSWMGLPDSELTKLNLEALREKDQIPTVQKAFSFELKDVSLPDNCKPVTAWVDEGSEDPDLVNVLAYILDRGLELDDYDWHWCPENGYKDRLILPFYNGDQIVGWTGRKITAGAPKYLTHSQQGYVFNMDAQSNDRAYCIVVEGQFDAIAVSGVAIMHNDPSDIQCARINTLAREIIVVPDRDRPGAKMLKAALAHGWSVSVPPWDEDVKDVADAVKKYGKLYTLATILHYKESGKIRVELQKKRLESIDG